MDSLTSTRVLGPSDLGAVTRVVDREPLIDVFVGSRVHGSGMVPTKLGGELWGYFIDHQLVAVCYAGANLVPVGADPVAARTFADVALHRGRRCSSLVGQADAVMSMWDLLQPEWGPARDVRSSQPVMAITEEAAVEPDPAVRRVRPDEVEVLHPAAVAMFTEEVGISPNGSDGGAYYRARLSELVRAGRAFARFEDGEVVFKAEIGAVTPKACQVQGVWVRPDRRGHGLSVGGMAAVVSHALREIAPAVSLYVNEYNHAALGAYRKVGFTEVGRFATVML
ncbi:GNAT family N-acetyltransferase [Actinobacteria bacterium YIM 96077]|uniref:GNAT family N-acetyltransferase n=1 Tax=Phytoactinopolyspora halophila TaxID=1981511 RepID=A0A329QYX9_9ACTN|nr:GNAT family N-acetyltransferase [Actinobacteria bacterium YIM 96077]RAW16522.1 GNAT family N-acetyltransferase [Phytoactinopolyspora halophila]